MTSLLLDKQSNKLSWKAYLLLIVLCMGFFLPGISSIPPVDRDEPRFAQATRQMIESGDYTDIHFQEETRYKKPAGIYWLQAASVKAFTPGNLGEIWSYRIPSFIGATISVLMTAMLGTLLFGPTAGFAAALMLVSCVLLNVEARLAKTDAALLACVMLSQYALAKAYMARNTAPDDKNRPGLGNAVIFWAAQAAGFMIKGPILLMISAATILTVRLHDRKAKTESGEWLKLLYPAAGIVSFILLIAPWFAFISMSSHGDFIHQSAGNDLLEKLWHGQNKHIIPPGIHLALMPAAFFPASIIILLTAPYAWRKRTDPLVRFCLGWIIPTWIILELSLTKLPHYVLPLYPPIAILASKFLFDGAITSTRIRQSHPLFYPLINGLWLFLGSTITASLIFIPYITNGKLDLPIFFAGFFFLSAITATQALLPHRQLASILTMTLGALVFFSISFGHTFPNLKTLWISKNVVLTAQKALPCEKMTIAADSFDEPSLVFLNAGNVIHAHGSKYIADAIIRDRCVIGLVNDLNRDSFLSILSQKGIEPEPITHISGYNLGGGRHVEMTMYKAKTINSTTPIISK